jgi:predicted GNAT family acetyltransferase
MRNDPASISHGASPEVYFQVFEDCRQGETALKVVALYDRLERIFWNHIKKDELDYYFFVLDWKLRRDQTRILMAMENDEIEGLMLIHRDYIVQLRGSNAAVKMLLDDLTLEKVELQAPLDCEDVVLAKYDNPKTKEKMTLMSLRKGEEHIQITTAPVRLNVSDAEEALELTRKADPAWWGETSLENMQKSLQNAFWLGIKQDQKIVSVGMSRLVDFASNIGVAATQEEYRNRGYATSIVSALVSEILKVSSTATIHVISDNVPAVRAYSKVGFKPYRTYLSIRT